jgi:hypothetical protein
VKITITVGDELLRDADRTARALGLTRSRLFCLALERFLQQRRYQEITEQLNRVYSIPDPDEKPLPALMKKKLRAAIKDRW